MSFHPETRNALEADQLITTYQTMVRAIMQGRLPQFTHSSRIKHHFFVIEILLQVVALEAYIHGTSRDYGFRIPEHRDVRKKDGTKKKVQASLEFKTRFFLKKAKAKIYKARIPIIFRQVLISEINSAFELIKKAIRLRNKIGHGEVFFALKGDRESKHHKLSKFLQNVTQTDARVYSRAFALYKLFCDHALGIPNLHPPDIESIRSFLIFLFTFLNRYFWEQNMWVEELPFQSR